MQCGGVRQMDGDAAGRRLDGFVVGGFDGAEQMSKRRFVLGFAHAGRAHNDHGRGLCRVRAKRGGAVHGWLR